MLVLARRNLTISSASNDSSSYATIDLDYIQSGADICSTCTVHFDHIALAKERRGFGGQVDFFTGTPGALLLLTDVYRLRQGCTTPATAKQITDNTEPSVRADGLEPNQQVIPGPADWKGEVLPNQVHLFNWSFDFPMTEGEGRRKVGGYSLVSRGNQSFLQGRGMSSACSALSLFFRPVWPLVNGGLFVSKGGAGPHMVADLCGPALRAVLL